MHGMNRYDIQQEIRPSIKREEMKFVEIEIMLQINRRLFQRGLITEEMYRLAKEEFIRT